MEQKERWCNVACAQTPHRPQRHPKAPAHSQLDHSEAVARPAAVRIVNYLRQTHGVIVRNCAKGAIKKNSLIKPDTLDTDWSYLALNNSDSAPSRLMSMTNWRRITVHQSKLIKTPCFQSPEELFGGSWGTVRK